MNSRVYNLLIILTLMSMESSHLVIFSTSGKFIRKFSVLRCISLSETIFWTGPGVEFLWRFYGNNNIETVWKFDFLCCLRENQTKFTIKSP